MPITASPALLGAINTNYRGEFKEGVAKAQPWFNQVAMSVTSSTATEVYQNLGDFPEMQEWIGERQRKQIKSVDWVIKNKKWEDTIEVPRTSIEDDQYGFYNNYARQLGDAAARLPDKLVTQLLEGGFTANGYDGTTFFSTTHTGDDGSTQSNKGTTALSAASYEVARAQMRNLSSAAGYKLDIIPDLLIVPPALEGIAKRIVVSEYVTTASPAVGTETNPNAGTARVLVVSRLTDANNWFLMDSSKILKPFIVQTRQGVELVAKTSLSEDNVFWMDVFVWGARSRMNAGYAMWQLIFGALVT